MPVNSISEVSGLSTILADKVGSAEVTAAVATAMVSYTPAWSSLTGVPTTFPPSTHAHNYEPVITEGTTQQYWRGDKTWATLPSGSDPWTWVKLASDVSNSTTALAATTVTFTAQANTTYIFYFLGAFTSAATTTGIAAALDIPSGSIAAQFYHPISATASGSVEQIADNATTGATTGVRAATTNVPMGGEGIIAIGATGGTVTLMFRSEVAASAVTLKGGLCALGYRTI